MANNYIAYTAQYDPFTYDELSKPLEQATLAHEKLETSYGELQTQSSVWEKLANSITDKNSDAYKTYKQYADDLRKQADLLAIQGLTPNSRRALMAMSSKYASDIAPIQEAWDARQKDIERYNTLSDSDKQEIFSKDPRMENIDNYYKREVTPMYHNSLKDIYTQAVKGAEGASKRQFNQEERRHFGNAIYDLVTEQGVINKSYEEVMAALKSDTNLSPLAADLEAYYNAMKQQYNYDKFGELEKRQMDNTIISGFIAGLVGNLQTHPMQNPYIHASAGGGGGGKTEVVSPILKNRKVYTQKEKDEKAVALAEYTKEGRFYIGSDGIPQITYEGWSSLTAPYLEHVTGESPGIAFGIEKTNSDIFELKKKYLRMCGIDFPENITREKLEDLIKNMSLEYLNKKAKEAGGINTADAFAHTEWYIDLDSSMLADVKNVIGNNLANGKLQIVDYDKTTREIKTTGETLDKKLDDITISRIVFSGKGYYVEGYDNDGTYRIQLTLPDNSRNAMRGFSTTLQSISDLYAEILKKPDEKHSMSITIGDTTVEEVYDPSSVAGNAEAIKQLKQQYLDNLQKYYELNLGNMQSVLMAAFTTNTSKSVEFKPQYVKIIS